MLPLSRAKLHGVEQDITNERLQFWISRSEGKNLSSQDVVDVERGLFELRKPGVQQHLWEGSLSQRNRLAYSILFSYLYSSTPNLLI
ncbi:hypothetical protein ISN44_As11g027510 [Arabidopsis suecica]|uniref:Uncharacterized protein n=1 Tax=Arabidopsis suecica TaxID=45249 RepID=A0A8T1ZC54_ARASU|nr:hypothetical protein ISN44_As11g027510 [Arabidopsis suecica]